MVIGKLVTLSYYWVTGHLNFTFLHIAGALFTLGTLYIFWLSFSKSKINWWYFLPVPFLLFQLQYHLVFLWAICSLQHQPVVFFISLSMFLLSRERFGWAVLAAVCATYAMSNGIFVWPAGFVILLLRSKYKQLTIWLIAGALAVGFYFHGLSAQGNESSIEFFTQNPHLSVLGFFAFLGGLFDFFPEKNIFVRSALPVLVGFIVMIWIVIWLFKQVKPWFETTFKRSKNTFVTNYRASAPDKESQNMFLLGILTFLLVNALIIGLLRPRFGFFVMIVSNYKMYPALFLTVAYLTFMNAKTGKVIQDWMFSFALTTSIIIWAFSIYGYLPIISERSKYLTVNGYNQEHNAFGLGHVPFSNSAAYVDTLMKQMVEWDVFKYPDAPETIVKEIGRIQNPMSPEKQITVNERGNILYVNDPESGFALGKKNGHYAFVRNNTQLYFFKMAPHKYLGRNILRQYDKGADTEIPLTSLKPGSYDLGIIEIKNGNSEGGLLRKITIP